MKKVFLLLFVLVGLSLGVQAQSNKHKTEPVTSQKAKKYKNSGKLFWGLYRWGSEKNKKTRTKDFDFAFDTAGFKTAKRHQTKLDTAKYERRSILGGAIQWTRRKKQPKKK